MTFVTPVVENWLERHRVEGRDVKYDMPYGSYLNLKITGHLY